MFKKEFKVDEKVVIKGTNNKFLDGQTVTVLGKTVDHVVDFYVVLLNKPDPSTGYKAIQMIETCLERIS